MHIDLNPGTVCIERVTNGFLVRVIGDPEFQEPTQTFVYADAKRATSPDSKVEQADAFRDLLWEHFDDLFQSKYVGGLTVTVSADGRDAPPNL